MRLRGFAVGLGVAAAVGVSMVAAASALGVDPFQVYLRVPTLASRVVLRPLFSAWVFLSVARAIGSAGGFGIQSILGAVLGAACYVVAGLLLASGLHLGSLGDLRDWSVMVLFPWFGLISAVSSVGLWRYGARLNATTAAPRFSVSLTAGILLIGLSIGSYFAFRAAGIETVFRVPVALGVMALAGVALSRAAWTGGSSKLLRGSAVVLLGGIVFEFGVM